MLDEPAFKTRMASDIAGDPELSRRNDFQISRGLQGNAAAMFSACHHSFVSDDQMTIPRIEAPHDDAFPVRFKLLSSLCLDASRHVAIRAHQRHR